MAATGPITAPAIQACDGEFVSEDGEPVSEAGEFVCSVSAAPVSTGAEEESEGAVPVLPVLAPGFGVGVVVAPTTISRYALEA
jgi:hypothetical protein